MADLRDRLGDIKGKVSRAMSQSEELAAEMDNSSSSDSDEGAADAGGPVVITPVLSEDEEMTHTSQREQHGAGAVDDAEAEADASPIEAGALHSKKDKKHKKHKKHKHKKRQWESRSSGSSESAASRESGTKGEAATKFAARSLKGEHGRSSSSATSSKPSRFMAQLAEEVQASAQQNLLGVLFDNQLELAAGRHCVVTVPARAMPEPRWSALCPKMRLPETPAPSTNEFVYFDGFDFYRTKEEALDTVFADPLIRRPNAEYVQYEDDATFTARRIDPC